MLAYGVFVVMSKWAGPIGSSHWNTIQGCSLRKFKCKDLSFKAQSVLLYSFTHTICWNSATGSLHSLTNFFIGFFHILRVHSHNKSDTGYLILLHVMFPDRVINVMHSCKIDQWGGVVFGICFIWIVNKVLERKRYIEEEESHRMRLYCLRWWLWWLALYIDYKI